MERQRRYKRALQIHDDRPPVFTINELIAEGHTVACTGTMEMVQQDGRIFKGEFCDIYQLQNEKIETMRSYIVESK